ncbi:MAG TPA: radical SAM protein [Clostridia bacterium]|nr:radical SAM protein [Clostridia bacterium]
MTKQANIAFFVPHAGCPHSCSFCNQKQISGQMKPLKSEDIIKTLKGIKRETLDIEKTELAFFGGSFTAIPKELMLTYLKTANEFKDSGIFRGIRISTRPDAVSDETLSFLKEYGVTSIELGAQSTDDNVLTANGRGHTALEIEKASERVKKHGFSLGLQMMTGLYKSTAEKDLKTCTDIIKLKPDTVRIYPTIVIKGTRLETLYNSGEYTPETLEEAVDLCALMLPLFYENNIKVIRLGLHSGGAVEEGYIAGPYHPSFGELCESRLYLKAALIKLKDLPKGEYIVKVKQSELSKMIGQKRINIEELKKHGYYCKVKGRSLARYEIEIEKM